MQDNYIEFHANYAARLLDKLSSQSIHALVLTVLSATHQQNQDVLERLKNQRGWHSEWKQAKRHCKNPLAALAHYARFIQAQLNSDSGVHQDES